MNKIEIIIFGLRTLYARVRCQFGQKSINYCSLCEPFPCFVKPLNLIFYTKIENNYCVFPNCNTIQIVIRIIQSQYYWKQHIAIYLAMCFSSGN